MAQLELPAFQAQNASLSYWILLRNVPVGAARLPGSAPSSPESLDFLKDSLYKVFRSGLPPSSPESLVFLKDSLYKVLGLPLALQSHEMTLKDSLYKVFRSGPSPCSTES